MKKTTKLLPLLLALILTVSLLPLPARAATAHDLSGGINFYARDDFFTTTCSHCGALTIPAVYSYPIGNIPLNDFEWGVLALTNVMRHYAGLPPVTAYNSIQQACDIRAEEVEQYFSHTRPNGTSCFTVFDELGIPWYAVGENIAWGQRTPKAVTAAWTNSTGHRENMLNPDFSHMGVGFYSSSWVQLFTDGSGYTGFRLIAPSTTVEAGTAISTLGIYAVLNSSRYGKCYLPILDEYCTGYNANTPGTQTVTISVLGFTGTFTVTVQGAQQDPCADGHTTELRGVLEATCSDVGYTGDTYCTVCGDLIQRGAYTPPKDHTWNNGEVTREPTVDAEGIKTFTCIICGETENDPIPKLDPPATEPPTPALPTITGTYTTDIVFPAGDLGVNAPDSILRATMTFTDDGRATTTWQALDLTALRLYFRNMFVNAYYACAYGAGITDLVLIEQVCKDSTGLSVSDYMDTIVTPAAIEAAFTPADTTGTYRYNATHTAIFTDMAIMGVPSDPDIANPVALDGDIFSLSAASYGKPDYIFICTRK